MRFLSSLLKRRRLTAAYSFMKALASANFVEEGVPDSDLIVLHGRAGSGLFSRSARNSSHFFWRGSYWSVSICLGLSHMELCRCDKDRVEAMDPIAE